MVDLEQATQLAEEMQKECHTFIDNLIKMKPDIKYDDAFHTWLFIKLAEIQLLLKNERE